MIVGIPIFSKDLTKMDLEQIIYADAKMENISLQEFALITQGAWNQTVS